MTDFEYHVQFPTPRDHKGVKYNGPPSGQTFPKIWPTDGSSGNENELVVILLGWAGAKHQYLSKYSDVYLQRGCIVLRYITPLHLLFVDIAQLGEMTRQLITVLQDLQLETHPIFFHVFSNGGAITYSSFLREMEIDEVRLDIRGTIFDSAPAPRKISVLYGAIVNINGTSWFRHFIAIGVVLMFALMTFWFHIKSAFRFCIWGDSLVPNSRDGTIRPESGPDANWIARLTHAKHQNFLFIYSDADDLIAADQVEEFGKILTNRGNKVKYLKFTDSPHVRHCLVHPMEYVNNVTVFIRTAMAEKSTPTSPTPTPAKKKGQ